MCGIAGVVALKGPDERVLSATLRMSERIHHRGPDGEGILAWNGTDAPLPLFTAGTPSDIVRAQLDWTPDHHTQTFTAPAQLAFAHRRLAIIDLAVTGHQPMNYSNGELWMTYNGEIYNYVELRSELESKGHSFRTKTDSEVILAAYKQWGVECTKHFNGMWAFVIWDRIKGELFASRDRFGVKPFYYFHDKQFFVFASELKALSDCSLVKTSLNHTAVGDYFVDGEIEYKPEGFFKNLIELFPGTQLTINLKSGILSISQWYELKYTTEPGDFSEDVTSHHILNIRELLIESIRKRLRSDVAVGSCLSGGIDSSAICGIIAKLVRQDSSIKIGDRLKLFTAAFDDPRLDESSWAKKVVDATGADWKKVIPRPEELMKDVESLIYSQDVPIWSTSTYAQHRVMRLASENGIRVLLDGQGGDELFAGYMPYFIPFWKELKSQGETSRRKSEMNAWGQGAEKLRRKESIKQYLLPNLPSGAKTFLQKRYFPDLAYIAPELLSAHTSGSKARAMTDSLNGALHGEFVNTRLKGYLKCEDRCSMWHSVESRTPFADDHQLIEYVFNIPGTLKIKNGTTKYLLREAVAPFIPEAIHQRRDKMGYVTPNNLWITQLKDQFRPYFEQDFDGILRKDKLMKEYDSFFSIDGKPENGRIFKFIAFAVWKKMYHM